MQAVTLHHLSPRERAVALLIAQDKPIKVICDKLKLHPRTVAIYIRRAKAKLGVQSLVGIALIVVSCREL